MALRIPWDKYETALLIDVCTQIESRAISRKDAITNLSKMLRQRAVENGLEIDEIYRNVNGISMQLSNIQRLLHHAPYGERHNTKVFIDMANIFLEDKEQYNAILAEAKGESRSMENNQELFIKWLSDMVPPARLSDYYMVFEDIETYAKKKKITTGAFFETTDSVTSAKLLNSISSDKIFRFIHKRKLRNITDVSQLFHKYTKENESQRTEANQPVASVASSISKSAFAPDSLNMTKTLREAESMGLTQTTAANEVDVADQEDDIEQNCADAIGVRDYKKEDADSDSSTIYIVDFLSGDSYAFTKPISVNYFGEEAFESSWRKLYVRVCAFLIVDYPDVFAKLRKNTASGIGKYLVYDVETAKHLTVPAEISEGYYVETNRNAADLIHSIRVLLDACRVDYENLAIRYTKTGEKPDELTTPLQEDEEKNSDTFDNQKANDSQVDAVPNQSNEKNRDPVIDYLVERGIEYVDKRYNLGCLWIIGGKEISDIITVLQESGVSIRFKSSGGNATQGRDAWWTKDNTDNVIIKNNYFEGSLKEAEPDGTTSISVAGGREAFSAWLRAEGLTSKSSGSKATQGRDARLTKNNNNIDDVIIKDNHTDGILKKDEFDETTNIPVAGGREAFSAWLRAEGLTSKSSGSKATQGRDARLTKNNTDNVIIKNSHLDGIPKEGEPDRAADISVAGGRETFSAWLLAEGLTSKSSGGKAILGRDARRLKDNIDNETIKNIQLESDPEGDEPDRAANISAVEGQEAFPTRLHAEGLVSQAPSDKTTQGRDAKWAEDSADNVTSKDSQLESDPEEEKEPNGASNISASESRMAFSLWLRAEGLADGSVRTSLWALSKVDDYAIRASIITGSLYEVTSTVKLDRIWNQLIYNDAFVEYKRKNSVVSFAFNKYRSFRSSEETTAASSGQVAEMPNEGNSLDDSRQMFIHWMETQGFSRSTCSGYASAIASIDEYALRNGLVDKSFYEMNDYNELEESQRRVLVSKDFASYNAEQHNRFSAAMRKYLEFRGAGSQLILQTVDKQRISARPTIVRAGSGVHPGRTEFEEWLRAANSPAGSIKTYADSVERIGKFLLEKGLEDRNIFSIRGIARLEGIRANFLNNEEYTQGRTNVNLSLDLYGLKKYINFRKNNSSDDLDERKVEQFSTILQDNFENGFRITSMIDRNRFKQYYADLYGDLEMDDEQILQFLQQVGTLQTDRIFIRNGVSHSDLLDDIQAEIAATFKKGASCVYYSELYSRYQEKLATQLQVFSQDVLKQLLISTSYEDYRASKHYFYLAGQTPNADDDIRKLMHQSVVPLDYEAIHRNLWYIPLDTIKHCLVTTADIVNVAQETYFYAPNLPISTEELSHIAELIHGQLGQKSFVTDLEMRTLIEKHCRSVAINTEGYTTWGLRNCLSVLLRDRFSFVGPIISEKGQALNTSQVFAEFSRSHDLMTFDELKTFSKEINNGIIYWDSVLEVMVRISQDEYVPKGQIDFDIEAIDSVLDKLMDRDYAPLKSFRLFLIYPAISVPWNEFVLESYVAGYSKKFSLMHASYTATECCGGIVRKESKIKDFQSLVTEVLAHSDSWQTKNDALALLVSKGYLQRRHYTKIDVIIPEAKLLREKYGAQSERG